MTDTNSKSPGSKPSGMSILTSAPGSYAYTSSSSLLRSHDSGKGRGIAVPPPTLPKYVGSTTGYRLASLERLANRQRLYEHQNGSTTTENGTASVSTSVCNNNKILPAQQSYLGTGF